MKKKVLLQFILFSVSFTTLYSQDDPVLRGIKTINRDVIQAQLEFLSSNWMEGRRSGEKGELISSDYIASMLKLFGVKPFGDATKSLTSAGDLSFAGRTYFQNFNLVRTTPGNEQMVKLNTKSGDAVITNVFVAGTDFTVRPATSAEIEAPVVFAGYGFISEKLGFNDFANIDIKGKYVMRIAGIPAFATSKLNPAEITAARRDLENLAREKGAVGFIEVNPNLPILSSLVSQAVTDMSPAERVPRPNAYYSDYSIAGSRNIENIVRIVVSLKTAEEILRGSGNNIGEYRKKADENQPYSLRPVEGKTIYARTSVVSDNIPVRNVIGIIEGNKKDQFIVLGAHYDHMGMNNGYIWNGADDNGSGTVGVMTIAKAIMETGRKPDKSIIIALWTAEEQGLLGSEYFVSKPPVPLKQIRLNVNFDMISRYIAEDQKNKAVMTYTASEKSFKDMTASNLKKYGIGLELDYQPSNDPPGGSDHRSFVAAGIPVMRFKPGHREEYHTPKDEISTIDWDIMEKIIEISFVNIWQLADTNW